MIQSTVNERIKIIVEHFANGNKSAFARTVGISNQSLAEILGSRQSAPSFPALQKMLTAFPQLSADWLVMGQGQMLRHEEQATASGQESIPEYATREQYQELVNRIAKTELIFDAYKSDLSEKAQLEQVYRIGDVHPADKKLADRLSITSEEARELVLSGRIRATYIGKDNERARRNGVSYLITEAAVREFLKDNEGKK